MSAPKFTPTPWILWNPDEWTASIVTHEGELPNGEPSYWALADVSTRRDEWLANARLIAAAPELYEAVAMLVEWWDREDAGPQYSDPAGRDGPKGDAEQRDWFYGNVNLAGETHKLARAALAKARGEA